MPEIRENSPVVTQITTVKLHPETHNEVLDLMIERARFMATQPGFVSVSLHRNTDGSHVVNYIQWTDRERLAAAHHAPEFRRKWPRFGELIEEVDPCLYDVVHVEQQTSEPRRKSA
jgi:quinol monooxygenase YgiN